MSSPTRNAPCPCGSGRKYKHCCLGPAPTSASPYSRADRERALTRLGKFASSAEFESYREAALELYWRLDAEPDERLAGIMDEALPAFFDWFALDLELERGTVVDRLLARQAHTLPSGEAEFLRRLRDSQVRLYEITRVRRNEGMTLADLWTGEIKDVRERLATGQLVPWDLIAARVTAGPEGELVFEHIPHVFPAELKDELLRRLRRAFKRYRKDDPALDEAACFRRIAPLLNHIWLDQVALRPLPAIRTPEGDALVITKVHYEMEDPRAIRELLNRHPGLVAEGDAFVWLEGDEDRSGRRVLGRIELEAKRLRLETWSERRAESGRRLLEDLLGNRVRYRTTTCEDALQAARRAPPPKEPREAIPAGVEAEVLREYLDRHYLAWLDEPVPALGGRTPRHSARLKTGRPKLIGLLKAMETRAARDRLEGRPAYDTAWLWAELGLARSPHDQSGGGEADARSADGG